MKNPNENVVEYDSNYNYQNGRNSNIKIGAISYIAKVANNSTRDDTMQFTKDIVVAHGNIRRAKEQAIIKNADENKNEGKIPENLVEGIKDEMYR